MFTLLHTAELLVDNRILKPFMRKLRTLEKDELVVSFTQVLHPCGNVTVCCVKCSDVVEMYLFGYLAALVENVIEK